MTVYWLPEAIIDRQEIFDYVSTRNPAAAIGLDNRFEKAAKDLEFFPDMGAPGLIPGTQELYPHANYRLVYEVQGPDVFIQAVVHGARQWPPISRG